MTEENNIEDAEIVIDLSGGRLMADKLRERIKQLKADPAEKQKTIDGLIKDIGIMNDKCVEIRRAQCERIEELKQGGKQLQADLAAAKKHEKGLTKAVIEAAEASGLVMTTIEDLESELAAAEKENAELKQADKDHLSARNGLAKRLGEQAKKGG